ncbi:hypothetical protein EVAR_68125_1 [Eumeta japonica]|uniref:Uncharacterized protein n=1 Tax=Eumeta variegata TaxID=151549 RepID=A0A4C1ZEN3_EUMVA|nr:hypothetical protein EVAR_68125_1 [Eumeta japonica]
MRSVPAHEAVAYVPADQEGDARAMWKLSYGIIIKCGFSVCKMTTDIVHKIKCKRKAVSVDFTGYTLSMHYAVQSFNVNPRRSSSSATRCEVRSAGCDFGSRRSGLPTRISC